MDVGKNLRARRLFKGIAHEYDLLVEVLSFGQNARWRNLMVSHLSADGKSKVLDICTGTAGVAIQISRRYRCQVIGLDISENMLMQGQRNVEGAKLNHSIGLIQGRAESMGFPDEYFDAITFTYLLRYVDDPQATLVEICRVLKPGGSLASLDFAVPHSPLFKALWLLYTRGVLPAVTRFISPGWREVGSFLGPNISQFYRRYSLDELLEMWRAAGIRDAQARRLSLGGGVVMWGSKEK